MSASHPAIMSRDRGFCWLASPCHADECRTKPGLIKQQSHSKTCSCYPMHICALAFPDICHQLRAIPRPEIQQYKQPGIEITLWAAVCAPLTETSSEPILRKMQNCECWHKRRRTGCTDIAAGDCVDRVFGVSIGDPCRTTPHPS